MGEKVYDTKPRNIPNYLGNLEESERLARKISRYWSLKGKYVNVRVEQSYARIKPSETAERKCYVIRSDMHNGLPLSENISRLIG